MMSLPAVKMSLRRADANTTPRTAGSFSRVVSASSKDLHRSRVMELTGSDPSQRMAKPWGCRSILTAPEAPVAASAMAL